MKPTHWIASALWGVFMAIILFLMVSMVFGATPGQVQICSVPVIPSSGYGQCAANHGKLICGPLTATDPVRTQTSAGAQVFLPFNTLGASSKVVNCIGGQWSTVAAVGVKIPATPPVTPPPVTSIHDYTIGWGAVTGYQVSHSGDGGKTWDPPITTNVGSYVFKGLPANITQCFQVRYLGVTGVLSDPTTTCVGPQTITAQ